MKNRRKKKNHSKADKSMKQKHNTRKKQKKNKNLKNSVCRGASFNGSATYTKNVFVQKVGGEAKEGTFQ
jgi:hypothetical protein